MFTESAVSSHFLLEVITDQARRHQDYSKATQTNAIIIIIIIIIIIHGIIKFAN